MKNVTIVWVRDHADHNAAKNIRELWLSRESAIPEDSISNEMETKGQATVNQPNVSPRFGLCPNRSKAGTSLQASPVGSWYLKYYIIRNYT